MPGGICWDVQTLYAYLRHANGLDVSFSWWTPPDSCKSATQCSIVTRTVEGCWIQNHKTIYPFPFLCVSWPFPPFIFLVCAFRFQPQTIVYSNSYTDTGFQAEIITTSTRGLNPKLWFIAIATTECHSKLLVVDGNESQPKAVTYSNSCK